MNDRSSTGVAKTLGQLSSTKRQELLQLILRERKSPVQEQIPRRLSRAPAPLSFAQQRLWLVDRLEPGNPAYNVTHALRLRGVLDTRALRASLDALVRRHETLRTTFAEHAEGEVDAGPVQVIHPPGPSVLPEIDLRRLPDPEGEASRLAGEEAMRSFDLARGPLLQSTLLRLGEGDHVLCFTLHHIVCDGWSTGVLVREVSALYDAFSRGQDPAARLPELPIQYADYAVWQREWLSGRKLEEHIGYWKARLSGAPPLLEIPLDRPRAVGQSMRAASHPFVLSAEVSRGLQELTRREGATLFMTLLAGWQALLGRYAGQDDVVVGTPIAGRGRQETEGLIGFFVNILALRADLSGDPTWAELLGRVQRETLGAFEHQELSFDRLVDELGVERSLTHTPVFQTVFSASRARGDAGRLELGKLALEPFERGERAAQYDLELMAFDRGEVVSGGLGYRPALFDPETIARLAGHLEAVLESMAADPARRLSEVSLLRGSERAELLSGSRAEPVAHAPACVHELFSAQAARTPGAAAATSAEEALTYAELERRSNRLARHLRRHGVGPEVRVGICLERGPEMLVGVLGVLKAGGAYVPLDPAHPAERLAYTLSDSGATLLVARGPLLETLPPFAGETVCLDRDRGTIARESDAAVESGAVPGNAAYVIYTSGSTGRPKGVVVEHASFASTLLGTRDAFGLAAGEETAVLASYAFDIWGFEVFTPLLSGGTVRLLPRETVRDVERLVEELAEVDAVHAVPALMREVVARVQAGAGTLPRMRRVYVGGDAVPPDLIGQMGRVFPAAELRVLYGPTETSILGASSRLRAEGGYGWQVVGRALPGVGLYVCDAGGNLLPDGVQGELWIGGAGVGRGYLGRAELTAEKFVPDPFAAEAGARAYRTGDRVRRRADGELEFLGRVDAQVKIRGFRVEPGEVEAVLLEQEEVHEAVVTVREDAAGQKRLVAYVVPAEGAEVSTAELRGRLGARLPEHMVPAALVVLEALPLTATGKVDRRALPAPDHVDAAAYVAPRTPTQEVLAGIWAEVLGTERVGVEENFFELGGHSLLATRAVSRARQAFGVEVPLRALFEAPTVAGLAGRIEALRSAGTSPAPPMVRVPRTGPLPLSFAQQRLWVVDRIEPGSVAYNMPSALRLRGSLDAAALRASLDALVARHETLRTVFTEHDGGPVQVIHPPAPVPLPVLDLRRLPAQARELEAQRRVGAEAVRPFDLERGPLLRSTLLRLADDDHVLLFTLHHVVSDEWSSQVLVREVTALYGAFSRGAAPALPELPIQYADYAVWQREWMSGETLAAHVRYWRERLAGAPPLLELPADRPRAVGQSALAGQHRLALSPETSAQLRGLSRRQGATLFMTLLGAWQVLLGRYAGQEDVVVGSPIAGRTRMETEGLIGFFVNMLALRGDLGGGPSFAAVLGRTREAVLGAFEHQELPFERLVDDLSLERSLTHTPLFQVTFSLAQAGRGGAGLELGELRLEPVAGAGEGAAQFDLDLSLFDGEETVGGVVVYRSALFEAGTIERLAGHLEALLSAVAADPERRVAEVPLLAPAERVQVLEGGRGEAHAFPRESLVHEVVAARAAAWPAAAAVSSGGRVLSYGELEAEAGRLAGRLRGCGVGPEARVGVFLDRSAELAVALLATLKAGGAFVPLDPGYPRERLEHLLADSGAGVVLTRADLAGALPESGATVILVDGPAVPAEAAPPFGDFPESLAYLIYTSGSTGRPKAAMVSHRSLLCYAEAMRERMELGRGDRVLQFASPSFDVMIEEVFPAWLSGACVVFPQGDLLGSPQELLELLERERISVVELPTAYWHEWVRTVAEEGARLPASLRLVLMGGERVLAERLEQWGALGVPLLHVFGLTETTVTSTTLRLEAGDGGSRWSNLPVGEPLANAAVYVLDGEREPTPMGVPGELYLGGETVARGYLGRPELTAERYVPDPFTAEPRSGARLYRTGDRVRWNAQGMLEFLGRIDQQVKVRGYRIEPAEIEAVLAEHPAVREAAVVVREDAPGDRRLVAYLVAEGEEVSDGGARELLRGRLPEYMVPSAFVRLEALPLTPNGKLDRRALPAPERTGAEVETYAAPRTATEEALCAIWAEVLRVERVGIRDNFFERGGDSILAIQAVSRARRAGLYLTPRQLFEHQTIEGLAPQVGEAPRARADEAAESEPAPLTPIQRWFFEQDLPEPGHWNMSLLLRVRRPLGAAVLARALAGVVAHHRALGLRLAHGPGGAWTQTYAAPGTAVPFHHVDLSRLPEAAQAATGAAGSDELQRTLDLERGPLLRAAYFDLGAGREPRLLLAAHHLVVDNVSWQVILEDLETACVQVERGEAVELGPESTSYLGWARRLAEHARSGGFDAELAYWAAEERRGVPHLPLDFPGGANTMGASRSFGVSLGVEETRRLLQEVPAAYRTQINDVLLCALATALSGWTGEPRVLVQMEGHGREEDLLPDVDLTRTVGWFTTLFPVLLDLGGADGPGERLKAVKEQLRAMPGRGLGYGALRYLGSEAAREALAGQPDAEVHFEYMGQMDGGATGESLLGMAPESAGAQYGADVPRRQLLEVSGAVVGGALQLRWGYGGELHRRETIEALAEGYLSALRALIAHCTSPGAGGYTPSDFPLSGLDGRALEELLGSEREIEDVYPLTPMQAGMLFETQLAPGEGVYVGQVSFTLRGTLDRDALRRAWEDIVERHSALRTAFPAHPAGGAVQVVRRRVALPFEEEDWSSRDADWDVELEAYLREDRARGFDPARAPLMRVALLRRSEDEHVLVWSFHQMVLDGWSLPLVFRDLMALYWAASEGQEARLPRPGAFRDYMAWLASQDLERAERFWREALAGFTAPTPLVLPPPGGGAGAAGGVGSIEERLTAEDSAGLQEAARRAGATVNTLVQGAWALLLSRYAGEEEVVFGTTVSGRPTELEGVEEMVGLFINTLPVRVRVRPEAQLAEWLREVQAHNVELREHEYTPLVQVQGWSEVPRGAPLFESLVVFENFPVAMGAAAAAPLQQQRRRLDVVPGVAREQGSFPLSAVAELRGRMLVRVNYQRSRFAAEAVERVAGHLVVLLEAMAGDPGRRLGEVSLLRAGEREHLLHAWNGADTGYTGRLCIHELVHAQVQRTPRAPALRFEGHSLAYDELFRAACQLAHLLRARGVGPEERVAICMEPAQEMVVSVLGVLLAGGAYLPLDPELPPERRAYMLRDAAPVLLLTQAALAGRLEGCGVPLLSVDAEAGRIARESEAPPVTGVSPDNLAYVIYTSGSTGRPKGVLVEHRGVGNTFLELGRVYEAAPGERNLAYAPLHFDASVADIFVALCNGAELVLARRDDMLPGEDLLRTLREERITHLKTMPSALAVTPVDALPELRTIVAGGEVCPAEQVRRWGEGRRFFNGYGATEASIRMTSSAYTAEGGDPPIGQPVANTQLYVLDAQMEPAPAGVPGELYIGGVGVVRGYLGRPDLSAERFVPDPHRGVPGARLYRTGDVGRRRPDGEVEFLGRRDFQVKVRGYRVELGEIEAVLRAHAGVREALVLLREDVPGQARLVAYVAGEEGAEPAAAELRAHVAAQVPEYMVPVSYVVLERLPVTANGKIDRRALPAPERPAEDGFVALRTVTEELLAGIWAEVLRVERVGAAENFFEMGGHSLLATQVVSRARQAFGVEVPLRALFDAPTVAGLAARIEALRSAGTRLAPPMGRASRAEPLPLSFAQQRLWMVDRIDPGSPAYNMPDALRLRGSLDVAALRASLDEMVKRHETLRTTFSESDGMPVQVIHPPAPVAVTELDLRDLPEAEREAMAGRTAAEEAMKPFDLARGPLLRTTLLRLAEDDHVLCFTMHHIVSDGWSRGVLVREVSMLYGAFSRGEPASLPELPVQYADFAVWQRGWLSGEVLEEQIGFWKARLSGAPPLLEVPTDRPRAFGQSPRAASHGITLSPGLTQGLREISRREGTTLFMTLLCGWQALLARYAGQEDVVVGSPIAGRNRVETEGLIGFFVNMLALRADLGGDPTWTELLGRVREATLSAFDHQDLPFERLVEELSVERSLLYSPIFQSIFALDAAGGGGGGGGSGERLELGELALEPFGGSEAAAKFDLDLVFSDAGEVLGGWLVYRAALFEAATVARMAGHLETLLEAAASDPGRRVSEVSLLSQAERARVLEAWNATGAEIPQACVHELFAEQAERTPGAPAVLCGDAVLTYAELERRSNRLAHLLLRRGVGPETRVGMCLERGIEPVVAILGILKAGGAYVPLDPANPAARLREIVADAGVTTVLSDARAGAELPAEAEPLWLDDPRTAAALAAMPETAPPVPSDPRQLAYVIYTSGSTGRPKGVAVSHTSVVRLVRNTGYVPFGADERIAQISNLAFDAATFELWGSLLNGGSLVVIEREVTLSPADFAAELRRRRVTAMFVTAALFNRIAHEEPDAFRGCRHVLVGGDALDAQSLRRVLEAGGPDRLLNGYGPTETTTFAVWHHIREVEPGAKTVPIGRALANTTLYVLDAGGEPLPVGLPGELHIGGPGVARGYLGRPELTAERFVPDAFGGGEGGCTARATGCGGTSGGRWNTWGAWTRRSRSAASASSRGRSRPCSWSRRGWARRPWWCGRTRRARSAWWGTWWRRRERRSRGRSCGRRWRRGCRGTWCRPPWCCWRAFRSPPTERWTAGRSPGRKPAGPAWGRTWPPATSWRRRSRASSRRCWASPGWG